MKKKVIFTCIIFVLGFTGFSQNALLPQDLIVETRVPLENVTWYKDSTNFYTKYFSSLIYEKTIVNEFDLGNAILEKIRTDNLSVYDNVCNETDFKKYNQINYDFPYSLLDYQKISKEDALINFGQREITLGRETLDGLFEEFDTIIPPDPKSVKELFFYETWYFDENNFKFEKKVIGYSPIRVYCRDEDIDFEYPVRKKMFFLINKNYSDEKIEIQEEKNMILWQKVKYEFDFENPEYLSIINEDDFSVNMDYIELNNSPFFSYYTRNKLRNLIVEKALSGNCNIYDTSGNKIDTCTAKSNLGYKVDFVTIETFDSYETVIVETPVDISNITSVIFYEYWYINPETLNIKKEVVGIAPVYKYYEYGDWNLLNPKKRVAFVIYFDESKKF